MNYPSGYGESERSRVLHRIASTEYNYVTQRWVYVTVRCYRCLSKFT